MQVNAKILPVKTVPRKGEMEWRRVVEGENSSMIYLILCKNFCKWDNAPTPTTRIKIQIQSHQIRT
jgi:hypothetical protein